MSPERRLSLFRVCLTGQLVRGSCWLLLAGLFVFAWVMPLLTPWDENPQILQPARAQAAWLYAWLAAFTWLPFQAATLGNRLRDEGLLEFQQARGVSTLFLWFQASLSPILWQLAVALGASLVCLVFCLPKNPMEARLWFDLVAQYAVLYTLATAPLIFLGVALGTRAGEVIAFCVPVFLLFLGLLAASWLEPLLAGGSSLLHRWAWLALPHYHLADLTPRLVFKMGSLASGDFIGSSLCLGLQGLALSLLGLCVFRTRS